MSDALFASIAVKMMCDIISRYHLPDFQAAAFAGNAGLESAGFRILQEIKPTVAGSKGGYGFFQWTGPRRRAFFAWCKAETANPSSYQANLGFMFHELDGEYHRVLSIVRPTKTIEAATEAVMRIYLAPGIPHEADRVAYARRALAAYHAEPAQGAVS